MITERAAIRTDGFITNIKSRNPFDVIRADVVLGRLEKQAHQGCGLYYEIYEARLLGMAIAHLEMLPPKDRKTFIAVAEKRGLALNEEELERADEARADVMREIRADY